MITLAKNFLFKVLPYLRPLSLQTRIKLRKSLQAIPNCCKLQIAFKSQNILANVFRFQDRVPKELTSGVFHKFLCGLCNESYYVDCVRHLNVRTREYIGISPLTKKKVNPKGSAASDHLLLCNHSLYFETCNVLTEENRKLALELREITTFFKRRVSIIL